jgi:hypothetical protein
MNEDTIESIGHIEEVLGEFFVNNQRKVDANNPNKASEIVNHQNYMITHCNQQEIQSRISLGSLNTSVGPRSSSSSKKTPIRRLGGNRASFFNHNDISFCSSSSSNDVMDTISALPNIVKKRSSRKTVTDTNTDLAERSVGENHRMNPDSPQSILTSLELLTQVVLNEIQDIQQFFPTNRKKRNLSTSSVVDANEIIPVVSNNELNLTHKKSLKIKGRLSYKNNCSEDKSDGLKYTSEDILEAMKNIESINT